MTDDMSAYREVFLQESAEFIQSIVDGVLALESDPGDLEPVEVVFRGAHSLKGMAAAMGYEHTADLTHKLESLMTVVRDGGQRVDADLVDLILRAVDEVKALIADESSGRHERDASAIAGEVAARAAQGAAEPGARDDEEADLSDEPGVTVRVRLEEACVLKSVRAYMVIKRLSKLGSVIGTRPSAQDIEDEKFGQTFEVIVATRESEAEIKRALRAVTEVEEVEVLQTAEILEPEAASGDEAGPDAGQPTRPARRREIPKLSETQTVRVSIGHLDTMVNLVGELVINRARLETIAHAHGVHQMDEALEELRSISLDLQHEVMQTRMVPVGNIFNRFPRMVRDLARDLDRDIEFTVQGTEIELDRTVLDEIGDPLVHLLRNAIDHGIESAEERVAAGKPARGRVDLAAARERDQVHIIVSDDGRGMDVERIWTKAVQSGLVSAEQRDSYALEDILMLTCTPGFSTATEATKVSGRGVGMDVVRGKIEYLGGSLIVRSVPGEGSEFVLALPLTLAIIPVLLVSCGSHVFALPLGAVIEVSAHDEVVVDSVEGGPVLRLRDGRIAPLYRLGCLIGDSDEAWGRPQPGESVVLVETVDQVRALVVDTLIARQEVVIKPLSGMFRDVKGLTGATVLGDGQVALILDPRTLFGMAEERQ